MAATAADAATNIVSFMVCSRLARLPRRRQERRHVTSMRPEVDSRLCRIGADPGDRRPDGASGPVDGMS
jgi:hypothetical protein